MATLAFITTETGVSLGVVVTLITCTVYIVRALTSVKRDIQELKNNQYTVTAACEHALRLAIANPGIRVPDPRNPEKNIVVELAREDD